MREDLLFPFGINYGEGCLLRLSLMYLLAEILNTFLKNNKASTDKILSILAFNKHKAPPKLLSGCPFLII